MISYTCGIKWACTASLSCYTQIVCKRLVPFQSNSFNQWRARLRSLPYLGGPCQAEWYPTTWDMSTIQGRSLPGPNGSVVCKDNPLRCCKDMNVFFRFCHWSSTPTDVGLDPFLFYGKSSNSGARGFWILIASLYYSPTKKTLKMGQRNPLKILSLSDIFKIPASDTMDFSFSPDCSQL